MVRRSRIKREGRRDSVGTVLAFEISASYRFDSEQLLQIEAVEMLGIKHLGPLADTSETLAN
jgi:hypothetical protein